MKVITPAPLLRDAAEALGPVREDIVVIGASAVRVALHGRAALRLRDDKSAVTAATRELVATGAHDTLADARRAVGFAATRCTQRLGA